MRRLIIRPFRDGLVLFVAVIYPPVMAWIYFVVIGDGVSPADSPMAAVFGIGKLAQFLIPAIYVLSWNREELGWKAPTVQGLLEGAGFAALVALAMWTLYFGWLRGQPFIDQTPGRIFQKLEEFGCATPAKFIVLAGMISIVHSLLEEYYWRWFVFGVMKRYLPVSWAIVGANLAFMLHHIVILGVYLPGQFWTLAMPFSFCVAVGGMVWAWLYHRSGSLWGAWLSHALIDGAIMVVGFDLVRSYW